MLARITIVGRPNTGKSSIFNLLTKHKIAIVSDTENTTRDLLDYRIHDIEYKSEYILVDSGGLVNAPENDILRDVRNRAEDSVQKSDIILFVLEYDKISALDEEIARMLRKSGKHVIVIANKADNPDRALDSFHMLSLGFSTVIPFSASHSRGMGELRETIAKTVSECGFVYQAEEEYDENTIKLAIIGRPNVGKSSIVNAITGENKSIVRDMPGTTRDAIDTEIEFQNQKMVLIDTAGIRRAGKIGIGNIESWSVLRSERAMDRADIIAVVIDAFEGVTHHDQAIVGKVAEAKKGVILVINKWDKYLDKPGTVRETAMNAYIAYLQRKFDFLSYATPVFTSATE